jgi:hypothetical protein
MKVKAIHLWLGLPVAIIVFWLAAFYAPLSLWMEKSRKDLSVLQGRRAELDRALAGVVAMKRRDAAMEVQFDKSSRRIPAFSRLPAFMETISGRAKNHRVVLSALTSPINSLHVDQGSPVVKPIFELGLKGRFLDMGRFIEALAEEQGFNRIVYANISYDGKEYPVLTGKLMVEFKAWKGSEP